jgi:DNA-binding transcriptional ArsR family regulator
VRTYDATGETRTVAFDLDCKKAGGRAAVLRDFERLAAWLNEAGCAWLADESPSGGRHVYVLLDHRRTITELAPLLRELRASGALPTLDPSPMCNLTEGCIRPPGAQHRVGGHQRLLTPLNRGVAAIVSRTSSPAWVAFVSVLPALGRAEIDLRAPARDRGGSGPARPLAANYEAIARTGRYDIARYPSASEARAAVLLHALCRGWTPAEITRQVTDSWSGLESLYEQHYGLRYAGKALAGDLARAQARFDDIPFRGFHTSAKRPRAGGGNAARLHLRRWTAAFRLALADGRWDRSLATEQLLVALGDAARRTQSIYTAFGCRHLSMCAGTAMDHSTAARLLKRLTAEDDPFVLLIESDRGVDADVYELRIPDAYLDRLPADDEALPAPPHGIHPAFALLDRPIYRLYTVLERLGRPVAPALLATEARLSLSTVYKHLPALFKARLATRRRDGALAVRGIRALTRFARKHGAAARLAETIIRWRAERNSLRLAHGLPAIEHGRRMPRVAWPGQPPRARPSPAARSTTNPPASADRLDRARAAQEREIGDGGPNWRTDLDRSVIDLLQRELGARSADESRGAATA